MSWVRAWQKHCPVTRRTSIMRGPQCCFWGQTACFLLRIIIHSTWFRLWPCQLQQRGAVSIASFVGDFKVDLSEWKLFRWIWYSRFLGFWAGGCPCSLCLWLCLDSFTWQTRQAWCPAGLPSVWNAAVGVGPSLLTLSAYLPVHIGNSLWTTGQSREEMWCNVPCPQPTMLAFLKESVNSRQAYFSGKF